MAATHAPRRWAAVAVACALAVAGCGGGGQAADAPTAGPAAAGYDLYRSQGCAQCHSVDGSGGRGPTFAGLWGSQVQLDDGSTVEADRAYIASSVREPQSQIVDGYRGAMPAYDLSDAQIDDLVAYLRTVEDD